MMKPSLTILLSTTILLANVGHLRAQSPQPPMKVPASTEIDAADLPLKYALDKRYATLLQRFTNWNKDAMAYNGTYGGKTYEEGTKEAHTGMLQQKQLLDSLKSYNRDVAVFNADVPQLTIRSGCASQLGGTSVVDACNVPSGLTKAVARAIAEAYKDAPPGVSDRIRKGFQAVDTKDWKLARAWFQDALNRDPTNPGIRRLVALCEYTLTDPAPVTNTLQPKVPEPRATMSEADREAYLKILREREEAILTRDFEIQVNKFYLHYAKHMYPELMLSVKTLPAAAAPDTKRATTIESYLKTILDLIRPPDKKTRRTLVHAVRG